MELVRDGEAKAIGAKDAVGICGSETTAAQFRASGMWHVGRSERSPTRSLCQNGDIAHAACSSRGSGFGEHRRDEQVWRTLALYRPVTADKQAMPGTGYCACPREGG